MISLSVMTVRGLAALCSSVAESTIGAASVEEAATAVVRTLREAFRTPDGTLSDLVLARIFQTTSFDVLPGDLRELAKEQDPEWTGAAPCLVLLGTEGDVPAWNDRRRSENHQVITLTSRERIAAMPMVSALVQHLGVDLDTFLHGHQPGSDRNMEVFYVPEAAGSTSVPDQDFVREHGVRAVLGFGDVLPSGDVFVVVLFTRAPVANEVAPMFRSLAVAVKLALLRVLEQPLFEGMGPRPTAFEAVANARIRGLEQMLALQQQATAAQTDRLEDSLADALEARTLAEREVETVEALRQLSMLLSAQLDVDELIQQATDTATQVTGAAYGAFFYAVTHARGREYLLYGLSGVSRSAFEKLPALGTQDLFESTFRGEGVVRVGDVTATPGHRGSTPYAELPPDHLPVRSYLAVPVVSRLGETLGGFFFGHPEPNVFDDRGERLAVGLAAQVAISLDNAQLYQAERRTALALQQSLLPQVVHERHGLEIAYEYLPGGGGLDVGGDWFDVISLPGGRTALVIGDVMGRGIRAAAIMGQLRTAVRAYAVSDLPPNMLLNRINQIVMDMDADLIATCVYAVLDLSRDSMVIASAGHVPIGLIGADSGVELFDQPLGPPLGVPGAVYHEAELDVPPGSRVLLFTDGLVEHRGRSLGEGLEELEQQLVDVKGTPGSMCTYLLKAMLHEVDQDDDVTMLMVANTGLDRRERASAEFSPVPASARSARLFVAATLAEWGDAAVTDGVLLAVNELFINAVAHARTPVAVRLRRLPSVLVAEVEDRTSILPKRVHPTPYDEGHRGLNIVAVLADRWGTRLTHTGKIVWAEFDVPDDPLGSVT